MQTENKLQNILSFNSQETIGIDELPDSKLNMYWGCAPTRVPSLAYFVPLLKLRDCIRTNQINVTIFLADLHSFMDKGFDNTYKCKERTDFYEFLLTHLMNAIGVDKSAFSFVRGSEVQLTPEYMTNLLKFTTLVSVRDSQHAGTEVVKQNKHPSLSSLIYPLMQCLDEVALKADIQLGGMDQRKIFMLSRDFIPKLGFKKCSYILNPLIPSLQKGAKMSSSEPKGKIEFTDTKEEIEQKIKKAFCQDKDVNLSTNPCLSILKYIIFPIFNVVDEYKDYILFEKEWSEGIITSQKLKEYTSTYVNRLVEPIRNILSENKEIFNNAYN